MQGVIGDTPKKLRKFPLCGIGLFMGKYVRKDRFYDKAKEKGYASRAYFKLEQIQKKYRILKAGDGVVDLGCAPGGWLQVAAELVGKGGKVFGIDLLPVTISPKENVTIVQGDIYDDSVITEIKGELRSVNVVLSDMSPSISGVKFKDKHLSHELAVRALEIVVAILSPGGHFVTKIFPGEEFAGFKKELQGHFEKVVQFRPEATRKSSIEVYLVGMGFK